MPPSQAEVRRGRPRGQRRAATPTSSSRARATASARPRPSSGPSRPSSPSTARCSASPRPTTSRRSHSSAPDRPASPSCRTAHRCRLGRPGPVGQTRPMARVLVTEKIADGGLDALRAAGHEVDVQTGLDPEQLLEGDPGGARPDHPVVHPGHRRGPRGRHRPRGRRPGRHRPRQRRRRDGHPARRDGGQRAAVEHPLDRRAHHGACCCPWPARAAGPRRAGRRPVGALQVGRASSWPTRPSASSAWAASASSSPSGPAPSA